MSKVLLSHWREVDTRLRLTRKDDVLTFEIVEGVGRGETATDKFTVPFKDFLADIEKLK